MYEDLIYFRHESVDGLVGWHWIKTDNGAWSGPKTDWEQHHSKKWFTHVKTWDYCVQAGGNQGMYPRLLSRKFKRVFTFEPDPLNFHCLVKNCQNDNIVKLNAALGDKHGLLDVTRHSMVNTGMHKVGAGSSIPTMLIDDLELPSCGLIALDIEGYERFALHGAVKTIEKCRPVIVAEMPGTEVKELLKELGYREDVKSVSDQIFIPI
jgi:FkbM family methyltransferase